MVEEKNAQSELVQKAKNTLNNLQQINFRKWVEMANGPVDDPFDSTNEAVRTGISQIVLRIDRIIPEALDHLDPDDLQLFIDCGNKIAFSFMGYSEHFKDRYDIHAIGRSAQEVIMAAEPMKYLFGKAVIASSALRDEISEVTRRLTEVDDLKLRLNHMIEVAKNASADLGVTGNAKFFDDLSETSSRAAIMWLTLTIASLFFIFILEAALIYLQDSPFLIAESPATAIQLVSLKLVMFGALSYAAGFCAKNYRASRHNHVVNAHKATALKTYRALMEATSSDHSRDIILTQAAASIFSINETGFGGTSRNAEPTLGVSIGNISPRGGFSAPTQG